MLLTIAAATLLQAQPTVTPSAPPPEASPSAAPATPADNRPVLWQNIRLGMTVAEVRALYPEGRNVHHRSAFTEIDEFRFNDRCEAEVNIHHPTGSVDRVVINGGGSIAGRCSDQILTALSSRYGQAHVESATAGTILAREGRIYVWNRDGVTLRFKRFTNGAFSGGGLGAASWELTYTAAPNDLPL